MVLFSCSSCCSSSCFSSFHLLLLFAFVAICCSSNLFLTFFSPSFIFYLAFSSSFFVSFRITRSSLSSSFPFLFCLLLHPSFILTVLLRTPTFLSYPPPASSTTPFLPYPPSFSFVYSSSCVYLSLPLLLIFILRFLPAALLLFTLHLLFLLLQLYILFIFVVLLLLHLLRLFPLL